MKKIGKKKDQAPPDGLPEEDRGSLDEALQFSDSDGQACADELEQEEEQLGGTDLTDEQRVALRQPDGSAQAEMAVWTVALLTISAFVRTRTGLLADAFEGLVPKARALLSLGQAALGLGEAGRDNRLILVALVMLLYAKVMTAAKARLQDKNVSDDEKDRLRSGLEPIIQVVKEARDRQAAKKVRTETRQKGKRTAIDQQDAENRLEQTIDQLYDGVDVGPEALFGALSTLQEKEKQASSAGIEAARAALADLAAKKGRRKQQR